MIKDQILSIHEATKGFLDLLKDDDARAVITGGDSNRSAFFVSEEGNIKVEHNFDECSGNLIFSQYTKGGPIGSKSAKLTELDPESSHKITKYLKNTGRTVISVKRLVDNRHECRMYFPFHGLTKSCGCLRTRITTKGGHTSVAAPSFHIVINNYISE